MSCQEDRFFAAVSVLVAHGPVKQRLIKAYENNLSNIEQEDLPVEVQESFAGLRRQMHRVSPANGEGRICASVRKMSKVQADRCAELIVQLFRDIVRVGDNIQSPLPLTTDDQAGVPPFLVKSG